MVTFDNRITPMDVFKNERSNFTSDESHIVVFQTPSCKTFCSRSKRHLTFKISLDRPTESIKRTLTRAIVESGFKKNFFAKKTVKQPQSFEFG
jgi:thioredoxin-related protein